MGSVDKYLPCKNEEQFGCPKSIQKVSRHGSFLQSQISKWGGRVSHRKVDQLDLQGLGRLFLDKQWLIRKTPNINFRPPYPCIQMELYVSANMYTEIRTHIHFPKACHISFWLEIIPMTKLSVLYFSILFLCRPHFRAYWRSILIYLSPQQVRQHSVHHGQFKLHCNLVVHDLI